MLARVLIALIALGLSAGVVHAQVQAPSETAKGMVGAWEISNAARDKTCPLTFSLDPGAGGYKLELGTGCVSLVEGPRGLAHRTQ
jgi:hypothetical protein